MLSETKKDEYFQRGVKWALANERAPHQAGPYFDIERNKWFHKGYKAGLIAKSGGKLVQQSLF